MIRPLSLGLVGVVLVTGRLIAADDFDPKVKPFMAAHCVSCHGPTAQKGGLRLDTLAADAAETWATVADRVSAGEMPPSGRPRPPLADAEAFTKWATARLHATNQSTPRVELRRLNRVEYEYTLRDLLALPHLDIKDVLPPDDSAAGFNNVAAAQHLSYVQMARYLDAAELALDRATCQGPQPEPNRVRLNFRTQARFKGREGVGRGECRHVDKWAVFLRQPNSAQTPWKINAPETFAEGEYVIRLRCRGALFQDGKLEPPDRVHVASIYTRDKRLLSTFDLPAEAGIVEFRAHLDTDDQLELFCATLDDRNTPGAGPIKPYDGPGIAVEYLEIAGPTPSQWPSESHRRLYGDLPLVKWTANSGLREPARSVTPLPSRRQKGNRGQATGPELYRVDSKNPAADAVRLVRAFLARAYRGPVDESEVTRCLSFALDGIHDKLCFQDALRLAYKAALCSPDFLFLRENSGRLNDWALASRLSYFLWRSAPDAELTRLAAAGQLGQPATLKAQVERMLADPKASRFVRDFTGQWLDLDKAHDTAPDKLLYPEYFCDNYLTESSVREVEAYFAEMLRCDLPATAVVQSDFVMVNGRLAELYEIPGVTGSAIRRVPLPANSPRGGFMTMAGVLKVTANGLTTSPVIRGAWVLDRVLGRPSSPPPPNAGAIEPDTRGAKTIRELLDKHRRDPSCASCHARIDPPGFALESFDVMGAWRDRYRGLDVGKVLETKVADRKVRYKAGPVVDSTGVTAEGQPFKDISEFRASLVAKPDQLARNLANRLVTVSTGAPVRAQDKPAIDQVLAATEASGYGLRSLVHAVVQSDLFRNK